MCLLMHIQCIAQHCQYCTTSIVGINPISAMSKKTISGLCIYVVNENGIQYNGLNSIVDPVPTNNENISKTVLFWQNDSTKSPKKNEGKHFNFAHNHYLFRAFWSHSSSKEKDKLYIRIEDRDGKKNGGKFKTKVIPVSQLKLKLLCGYEGSYFKSDDYAPLLVELEAESKRDSSKTIKQSGSFRFEFDPSPLTNCPLCEGCICKSIQIYNGIEKLIFNRVFTGNSLSYSEENIDSIQVADYNFDGYPDFRIFYGFYKFHTYFIYNSTSKTYEEHPLLSSLILMHFDFEKKNAKGSRIDTKPFNEKSKFKVNGSYFNTFSFSGENLKDVCVTTSYYYNPWSGISVDKQSELSMHQADTSYYTYINRVMKLQECSVVYSKGKTSGNFKFTLELRYYNTKDNPQFGKYIREIKVKATEHDSVIYALTEEIKSQNVLSKYYCIDSLDVADYNFDGYPDFRMCKNSSQYTYMIFDKGKNTFIKEPLLNQMDDIEFDFTNKVAKARKYVSTLKKGESSMNPNADRTDKYHYYFLSGKGFYYVQEYITISTSKNNQQSNKKESNYYFYYLHQLKSISESEFKKAVNPSILKEYNVAQFIFTLDKNAKRVELPAEKGAYAYQIEVLNAKNRKVVFSQTFFGNKLKSPIICSDSLQIADLNFDGYPDFRVCTSGSSHTYYVYYKKKDIFIEEKRLSKLFNVEFDYTKKLVTGNTNIVSYDMGMHSNTIKVSLSAEELSKHSDIDNTIIQQPVVTPNISIPKKDSVLIVVPKVDTLNKKKPEKQFIKQWKNYQFTLVFNPPDIKPSPVYGSYVKVLEVKDLEKDSLIYSRVMRGDKYKEKPICTDSLLIDDYNFDGYPDYKMCDDYEGKRFKYYLYDDKKRDFVEDRMLSSLTDIKLYPDSFKLVGTRVAGSIIQDVWMIGKGFPTVKIFSSITDDDLNAHYTINTYIYKDGRLIEVNTPMPYKMYSKVKDGYRFQLEFNPADIVIPKDLGSYLKRLSVYKIESNRSEGKIFETSVFGNELKETTEQRDSFEIANYNFDKIPDVRFNNSFNPGQSVYYLSAIDVNEDQVFYYEQNLSHIQQIKRFEDRKKLTGTYTDKTDYNTVSFYGKYLDTMVVVKQNLNTMAITQTITYLNKLGKLTPIPNIKALEPKPKTKKEFGDYNFDGYEDFRTKKNENDERWDFFIYNNKKQSFEIDTLLSKMTLTYFDFENKVLVGQITKQINELDTYIEGYKTVNGKIILYSTSTCHREFRYAEKVDCTISELKDGKWVESFIHGAE